MNPIEVKFIRNANELSYRNTYIDPMIRGDINLGCVVSNDYPDIGNVWLNLNGTEKELDRQECHSNRITYRTQNKFASVIRKYNKENQ